MIIKTNHPPKMLEVLESRQHAVNAGCGSNRLFLLQASSPDFGLRALMALARQGKIEIMPIGNGDVFCKLTRKLG